MFASATGQFEMDRVQAGAEKHVGPLAHLRCFGIADDDARQIIIFRADKRIVGDMRVLKFRDVGFEFAPEAGSCPSLASSAGDV